jgi:hypothetical protein
MVILIDDVALDGNAEVAALQFLRENTGHCFAIGCSIACETITGIVGLNQYILDGVVLISKQA